MNLPRQRTIRKRPVPTFMELGIESSKINRLAEEISTFKEKSQKDIDKQLADAEALAKETRDNLADIKKISTKIESDMESFTGEVVGLLKEIKSQGLKGDKGEDGANGETPEIDVEEIAELASTKIKPTPASLKIIKESVELKDEEIVHKLNKAPNLGSLSLSIENIKDWPRKWNDIKAEISRNKGGYHGGGFNNIASASSTVSTGLDTLKFTGSGVASVTQTGRTVTVDITGGGGATKLTLISGDIDDSNTTFVFSNTPTSVIINGSTYYAGDTISGIVAWTNSGATITTAFPIGTGGSIAALA